MQADPETTDGDGSLKLSPRQTELLLWRIVNDFANGNVSTILPPDDTPERRVVFMQDGEYVEMFCEGPDDERDRSVAEKVDV